MNFIKTFLIIILSISTGGVVFSNSLNNSDIIDIQEDASLAEHEVVLYALNGFRGSSAKVKLGFVTAQNLKEHKIYVIRSIKIAPKTKLHIHYLEKDNKTYYRSKEKTEIKNFTRIQVAEYGDFGMPIEDALADPGGKIKGILYNSTRSKNVSVTAGRIDANQFKEQGMTFFKSYELAPGYEMTAYAFTGFKGESQVVSGKGTLDRLCRSLVLREINPSDSEVLPLIEEILETDIYAILRYDITKKQVKIKPGNYDHDQLKSSGIRFVQSVKIPDGYELWAYPFKGFKGDPIRITSSGKIDKLVMSVKFRKK